MTFPLFDLVYFFGRRDCHFFSRHPVHRSRNSKFVGCLEGCNQPKDLFDIPPDIGEASALWLAKNREIPLATDDGLTIKACKIFNIPFLTAIHFLLDIFETGIISDREIALVKVEKLAAFGRYNHRIIESAISRIKGERR